MAWRISRTEVLLWLLLGLCVVMTSVWRYGGPLISKDGIQYLSVAENIAEGRGIRTSVVHFDVERAHHEIPAPSTTFPPGYPMVVALLSLTGMSREWAGLLISAISYLALVPLLCTLAGWFDLEQKATRLVLLALLSSHLASVQSSVIATESLFTLVTISAVLLLFRCGAQIGLDSAGQAATSWRDWIFAGLLIGLGYWIRYAGLFLYAAGLLLAALALYRLPRRHAGKPVAGVAVASLLIGLLMWRNVVYTGSWKGGNMKVVVNPLFDFLKALLAAVYRVFLGSPALDRVGFLEVVFGVSVLLVSVVVLSNLPAILGRLHISSRIASTILIATAYIAVYIAGFLYLGLFSVISFGGRMFYPILPLAFLLIAWAVSETAKRLPARSKARAVFAVGLTAAVLAYCVANLRDILGTSGLASSETAFQHTNELLDANTSNAQSLRAWIETNIPKDEPIVATNGQYTSYALGKKTISLVSSEYSNQVWNEPAIQDVMDAYDTDVLLVYSDEQLDRVLAESEFLTELTRGHAPAWLVVAAESPGIKVFRRMPGVPQPGKALVH